jgi:hypothetical protein
MNELTDLAAGRWSAFHGLEECDQATADAQLGPPLEDERFGGMFGGEPAELRRYPATEAAPAGVTCWFLGDFVVGVELREPEPVDGELARLGPPDEALDSGLGSGWVQEVWADRGLVLHRREDHVRMAFGLAPIDLEAWRSDPLRFWGSERIRR